MRKTRAIVALMLCLAMALSISTAVSAAVYHTTTTHYYSCRTHDDCMWIKFYSHGDTSTGTIYDKHFPGITHIGRMHSGTTTYGHTKSEILDMLRGHTRFIRA